MEAVVLTKAHARKILFWRECVALVQRGGALVTPLTFNHNTYNVYNTIVVSDVKRCKYMRLFLN